MTILLGIIQFRSIMQVRITDSAKRAQN